MRAFHHLAPGRVALGDVPEPVPGPGEVLLAVAACGLCQTDVHLAATPGDLAVGRVLGHEIAGRVVRVGPGVDAAELPGLQVVHPVWSCGACRQCVAGRENACRGTDGRLVPAPGPGIREDGGLAEHVVVPARSLVAAGDLPPAFAAVLPDAGLVAWHCIASAREVLVAPATALVIGLGGLGQFACALLHEMGIDAIGVDLRAEARRASEDWCAAVLDGEGLRPEAVLDRVGAHGVDLVLDFVGSDATLRLATGVVAPYGAIRVPGQAGGAIGFETARATAVFPRGVTINRPYSGTRQELTELIAFVTQRGLRVPVRTRGLAEVEQAFADLAAGEVVGRMVVVP